jgi:rod shape-determining protein MreD
MRIGFRMAIGGFIALLLQTVIAPNIMILGAMPNFILVYVCVVAMVYNGPSTYVLAFTMGLLYDFMSVHPVGIMAAVLTLVAYIAGRSYEVFGSETVSLSLIVSMSASLVAEVLYAIVYVMLGSNITLGDAFFSRALPCALYDAAMVLIVYPIVSHTMANRPPTDQSARDATFTNVR